MKAISIGKRYEIYDDTLKAYDFLPAKTYCVRFAQMSGFYLDERTDLDVTEKIYGVHPEKADKVMQAFGRVERNLGVILSGDKGIGKSLFARLLSSKAVAAGLPVIIIDQFYPGIASYIESIDQEAVFLFDEFDKTFGSVKIADREADPQAGLLSMFDGTSHGKKLFIITCNKLNRLNDYLVNRPGRFHYHFRFDYPSPTEILEYLRDKLGTQYESEINKVARFSKKVSLNYDCLRAISFELSMGATFESAIQDLNIMNFGDERYNLTLHCQNGVRLHAENCQMDMFNGTNLVYIRMEDDRARNTVCISFRPSDCVYDSVQDRMVLPAEMLQLHGDDESFGDGDETAVQAYQPEYLSIIHTQKRNLHFLTA